MSKPPISCSPVSTLCYRWTWSLRGGVCDGPRERDQFGSPGKIRCYLLGPSRRWCLHNVCSTWSPSNHHVNCFHLAPARLLVSNPQRRKTDSSRNPSSAQSTIPLLGSLTNRTRTNSSPAQSRIPTCLWSLGKGAKRDPLGRTCSTLARARPFVIW